MKAPDTFDRCEDYLHEVAARISGLTDFGSDYLGGLRVLLASMDRDPLFTPAGRELAWDAVVMTMVSRAIAEENWKKFPEWRTHKISKPILITGLPRTGTTVLHKLMGVDPQFQGIENWLTASPMPRPPRETWAQDPGFQRRCGGRTEGPWRIRAIPLKPGQAELNDGEHIQAVQERT